jgi:hypothetical protein
MCSGRDRATRPRPAELRIRGAALALAVGLVASGCGGGDGEEGAADTTSTSVDLAARVQTFPAPSRNHVQGRISYPQTPPVGGDHNQVWVNCGIYSAPVVTEGAVHSMEHGAVWITYRPNLPRSEVDSLRRAARGQQYVLLSPWTDENLPAPIVASAWGVQLRAESATDPAIAAFVRLYAGGPQTPERGAPCSGGFGSPE